MYLVSRVPLFELNIRRGRCSDCNPERRCRASLVSVLAGKHPKPILIIISSSLVVAPTPVVLIQMVVGGTIDITQGTVITAMHLTSAILAKVLNLRTQAATRRAMATFVRSLPVVIVSC